MYIDVKQKLKRQPVQDNRKTLGSLQKLCSDCGCGYINYENFCQSFKEGIDSLNRIPYAVYDQSCHFIQRLNIARQDKGNPLLSKQIVSEISQWLNFVTGRFC